ncbi:LCP family protein [Corynebacterium kroppenstedtii]|uniref:LCP family protein n=1 Tax=Corynebacterium kroppenstedtii TaxID=161879 RepID=UPI00195DE37B|nr:LCP family protein [Corynebacterium kroppenstedtii]MDN8624279.1 LCP family protein [Corynebacterium kroppenstedtii]QRQ65423.1 LCP family protein [Corynebacterium kroppenstedtii]
MNTTSDDDYLRGPDGRPIVDRYGRPIRRRSGKNTAASGTGADRGAHRHEAGNRRTNSSRADESHVDYSAGSSPARHEKHVYQHFYAQPGPASSRARYQGGQPGRDDTPQRPHRRDERRPGDYASGSRPFSQPVPPRGIEEHNRRIGTPTYPGGGRRTYPSDGSRPSDTSRGRRWRLSGWGRKLGALLGVLILVALGTMVWVDLRLHRVDALANYGGRPGGGAGTNWLLVGSDSRDGLSEDQQNELSTGGDTGGGRTDSIILVHIPFVGKATMVSIPRDSYVDVPGHGKDKVNASYALGGPQLLQQTVEQATGLRIDHYAEIGFGGFAGVVDAVGGVKICVEQPMDDPLAGINLQPGCQKLDGPTALGFVRSRHSMDDGDIGRARNQRTFLAALVKKALSPSTFLNPFRAFPFVSHMTDSFTVDKHDHVWNLARLGIGLGLSPHTETIPIASYESTDVGDVDVWDDEAAQDLFNSLR